jgi:hypothetical protein
MNCIIMKSNFVEFFFMFSVSQQSAGALLLAGSEFSGVKNVHTFHLRNDKETRLPLLHNR